MPEVSNSSKTEEELRPAFNAAWTRIVKKMSQDPANKGVQKSLDWMTQVMEQNVPHGKQQRGLGLVYFYQELKPVRTEEEDELSYVLGWCLEIMQAACLIADDIMDGSETRRGKDCWYRLPEVGLGAINDAFLLENLVYQIIGTYFSGHELELKIMKFTQEMAYKTILGQSLDLKEAISSDIMTFTSELYQSIVVYKTAYYTFNAPLGLAGILAGIKDPDFFRQLEKVMLEIGALFQAQDDIIDCYGDPALTGKIGTDIRDGKCCWLILKAIKLADQDQLKLLCSAYGTEEGELVVRKVYEQLSILQLFNEYEDSAYEEIQKMIEGLPSTIPKGPIQKLLSGIYQREK